MTTPDETTRTRAGAADDGGARLRPALIVTGASEGIGLAVAHRFAAGTRLPVLMIARSEAQIAAAAADVAAKRGVMVVPLALDLTRPDAADRVEAALAANGWHCEILINNAGVGLGGEFVGHGEGEIANLLDLNVRALTLLTRRLLPGLLARRSGSVINIASLGGYAPGPYQAAYYASKAYVISLTRALAHEIGGQRVRMCVVAPGPVQTAFHAKMGADRAFYRFLVPGMTATGVARSTWIGWRVGLRVIHPGFFTGTIGLFMRVTPWFLLVPIIGWLLRQRYAGR